jgi:hypothetical protein
MYPKESYRVITDQGLHFVSYGEHVNFLLRYFYEIQKGTVSIYRFGSKHGTWSVSLNDEC